MKIAMLFPGYGSQYVGMGKELYDESRIMQEYFEEASNCLNINFVKLCFASSDAEISRLDNALLASFLVSSSLYALLKEQGIAPHLVVGHDAGEYAAIYASGGISFPDMLYMLAKYATFHQEVMQSLPLKSIRVTGLETGDVKRIVDPYIDDSKPAFISAYESDTEHIIVGYDSTIEKVSEQCLQDGAKKVIDLLFVDGYHSMLSKPVYDNMLIYSEKVDFKDLTIPLLTSATVKEIISKDEVKTEMLEQIVLPVHWNSIIKQLEDYDLLIELGPGTLLSDKLRKIYKDKKIIAINKDADVKHLKEMIELNLLDQQQSSISEQ